MCTEFSHLNPSTLEMCPCSHHFFLGCYEIESYVSHKPYIEFTQTHTPLVKIKQYFWELSFIYVFSLFSGISNLFIIFRKVVLNEYMPIGYLLIGIISAKVYSILHFFKVY